MTGGRLVGTCLGHFLLQERLGSGGMGEVYRARDEHLGRDVAIKVLSRERLGDEGARRRFRSEAQALARLSHRNIGHVYDFDSQDETDFLVMELVRGEAVSMRISAGPLSEGEVVRLGAQLAAALEEAHGRGIVHRDLKPANMIVTPRGELKVLDFGLAKLLGPAGETSLTAEMTGTGAVAGTTPYMAPEQLRGETVDGRTDIWGAGVVLYEMATGHRPFAETTGPQVVDGILNRPAEPPSRWRPVSRELERIVGKCLEKDPNRRYQSASELRVDLERLMEPSPTSTGVALPRRGAAVLRGRRLPLALIVGALAVVAVVVVVRRATAPVGGAIDSLAVLPLANLSGDPDQEFFADGMTEALIAELARLKALKVISRTSVMQYKDVKRPLPEIAGALGVRGVIEGSVMRAEGAVRITVQLIDAASDRHLWAESYTRDARDVLRLQAEVARAIAREVRVAVTPEEQANLTGAAEVDPRAHELLLQAGFLRGQADTRRDAGERAIALAREAVELAPDFALARLSLANWLWTYGANGYKPALESCAEARTELARALDLDPTLGEAHALDGMLKMRCDLEWLGAERSLQRALELAPGSAFVVSCLSWYDSAVGRHDEALVHGRRALELDPLNEAPASWLGWRHYYAHRFTEAEAQLEGVLARYPDAIFAKFILGEVYTAQGRYEEAVDTLLSRKVGRPEMNFLVGLAQGLAGREAEARRVLEFLLERRRTGFVPPDMIAAVYLGLGERDAAFEWLERSFTERGVFLEMLKVAPLWDPLRSDPRFTSLLERMRVPGA